MTEKRLSKYFDLEKLGRRWLDTPQLRDVLDAYAEDVEDGIRRLEYSLNETKNLLKEKKRQLSSLEGTVEEPTREEAMCLAIREQIAKLLSPMWIIETRVHPMPKCGYCDDERMIELHSPDGQTVKIQCSCRYKSVTTYAVRKVTIKEIESITTVRLSKDRFLGNDAWRTVRVDRIDPEHPEKQRLLESAFTTREKAVRALSDLGLEYEEDEKDA